MSFCSAQAEAFSGCPGRINAVGIKDISQGHDAFEFVNVGPIHNGQNVDPRCAHPFQSEMQGMVRMDMRKVQFLEEISELQVLAIASSVFQFRPGENADDISLVRDRPGAELTGGNTLERLLNAQLCRQDLSRTPHHL